VSETADSEIFLMRIKKYQKQRRQQRRYKIKSVAQNDRTISKQLPSTGQIRAINELLIISAILFEDWPIRLIVVITLILIQRRK
jgi:hypothetical protein